MRPTPVAATTLAAAACTAVAGLLAGCGPSSPSARPTVTVTVTAPASSAPASGNSTPPSGGAPACATAVLKGSLGSGGAAAGTTYYPIVFTNTSSSSCTLYGYPGVSFVTAAGSQVGAPATENPTYPRQLISVAPGATAHAELGIATAQNYPSATCSPVAVSTIKVFPPGQTSALLIPVSATACGNGSVPILSVQTVQPGNGQ